MRQITRESCNAFRNKEKFNKANMSVEVRNKITSLKLHGNTIAYRDKSGLYISNAGWKTSTTKERLNGLLKLIGYKERIYQKNFIWYFTNGKEIPDDAFIML